MAQSNVLEYCVHNNFGFCLDPFCQEFTFKKTPSKLIVDSDPPKLEQNSTEKTVNICVHNNIDFCLDPFCQEFSFKKNK